MLTALDKEFKVIKNDLPSIFNLMWTRRYYERGQFLLVMDSRDYSPNMKYIFNQDTHELAEINRVQINENGEVSTTQLDGYFIENKIGRFIVHPSFKKKAEMETIVKELVKKYANIDADIDQKRGQIIDKEIADTNLELAIRDILEVQDYSFKINYDFMTNKLSFDIWKGLDRTSNQNVNSQCVFSNTNKNLKRTQLIYDDSNYRNVCIVQDLSNNKYVIVDQSKPDEEKRYVFAQTYLDNPTDDALKEYGKEFLLGYKKIENIQASYQPNIGYTYRKDFDLGDLVELYVGDKEYTKRIIEVVEIYKNNERIIELTFGEKIKTLKDEIKEVKK